MSCVYPLDAWRSTKVNESGKQGITFKIQDADTNQKLQIPCGKCIGCTRAKQRDWSTRIYHESTLHGQNSFITLTYADNAVHSLSVTDLQLFFKRLRKLTPLRYFACGEYGETSHRPHYHAIIFGADFLGGAYKVNDTLYSNPILEKTWGKGFVSIGPVNMATCKYVAGYVNKKINNPDTFNLMSRRPGIGHSYLDKYASDMINTEKAIIDGKELPVPKRYIAWKEQDFQVLTENKTEYMRTLSPEQIWERRCKLRDQEITYKSQEKLKAYKI